jgi:hypothetical protein
LCGCIEKLLCTTLRADSDSRHFQCFNLNHYRLFCHCPTRDPALAVLVANALRPPSNFVKPSRGDSAPHYLLRDRDQIFGKDFVDQVKALGIEQVLSAPRSPWQRAYVERLIGSIRRECLDYVIVFGERSLHRALASYTPYYHNWRTHLSLGKDAPRSRRIQCSTEGSLRCLAPFPSW